MNRAQVLSAVGAVAALLAACEKTSSLPLPAPLPQVPAIAPVLTVQPVPTAKTTSTFDAARISLSGTLIVGQKRQALLSVDHAPPLPHVVGDKILGAPVIAIETDYVVFDVDGARTRVGLTASSSTAQAPGSASRAVPDSPLMQALAPHANAMSAPMGSDEGKGSGNAAFLEAIQKAQQARQQ